MVDCIKLSCAVDTLPEVKESFPIVENTYQFDDFECEMLNGWRYYSGSGQSDLGCWLLVKESVDAMKLVAFGEWLFCESCAYLGNILLSNKTFNTLNKWCGKF